MILSYFEFKYWSINGLCPVDLEDLVDLLQDPLPDSHLLRLVVPRPLGRLQDELARGLDVVAQFALERQQLLDLLSDLKEQMINELHSTTLYVVVATHNGWICLLRLEPADFVSLVLDPGHDGLFVFTGVSHFQLSAEGRSPPRAGQKVGR